MRSLVPIIDLETDLNNTMTIVSKACTDELIGLFGIWVLLELGSPHEGVDEGTGPKIRKGQNKGYNPTSQRVSGYQPLC